MNPQAENNDAPAQIFHTHRDEEVAKSDGTTQGSLSTYRSSQNRILTRASTKASSASAVDRYEISGLALRNNGVSLSQLAKTFLFIGMTSFGGGVTAYIRRIIVENKQWLTNEEFFPGLAFCQLLPGANVVGISLYIGNHLCGILGAFVAVFCIIFPPSLIFFGLGYLYFSMGSFPCVEAMLKGAGAVACGMMASMFVEAAQESLHTCMDILIFAATFLLVRVAHVHVPYAILIVAPIAIWWYRPRA